VSDLIKQLQVLPDDWGLVAVGANKRPYQDGWQNNPLTKEQAAAEIKSGRAKAIGVLAGPPSGGLLFVDHDGTSATGVLEKIGAHLRDLPKSIAVTSGRDGRFQILYRVPPEFWPAMCGRRVFFTGEPDPVTGKPTKVIGSDGKAEQLDLRWVGHQSVVIGAHPDTAGYRWLPGRSPAEQPLADALTVLIEQLIQAPDLDPTPILSAQPPPTYTPSTDGPLPLLEFITRDSRQLIESGGTPGSWNDDQLRLALDLVGTEAWILSQGQRTDISARDAFQAHISAAKSKASDFDERKAWHRFDGAQERNPRPGTPDDKLRARLAFHTKPRREPKPKPKPNPPADTETDTDSTQPPPVKPNPGGYFTPLGFDSDGYYYQPHATGQVIRLSRSAHTGTNLVALAPLCYWESLYHGKSSPNWTAAASDLFEQQALVGVYCPDRIRGRGAWWDQGRAVLHLGDRLLVDGQPQPITQRLPNSPYLYQRLAAIEGLTGIEPLSTEETLHILNIAERFHWEVPASGWLIAGWASLAPICGALPWRPHIWLTAGAGSGKSTLLDRFLGPLLGPLALWPEGATTEAFIRQELRADGIPVVFDEAESNEKPDQQRIQAVLSLARVASSSGRGVIGKGGADGTSQRFKVCSMFLLSSISTALKQGADKSRFAQLTMRNPTDLPRADRTAHWEALDRDLDRHITQEIGLRLISRTISLIPTIRASAVVFRRVGARIFDSQRLGDQYGTLLAGTWSLMSDTVPTEDQAAQLISSQDWEPYQQATEIPDEVRCIQTILQHQLRVEVDRGAVTRTIGELVVIAAGGEPQWEIASNLAEATLGRHGLRADRPHLLVSNTAPAIARILADTPWANCWPVILARLPGAEKTGTVRFKGLGASSRAIKLPLASL
jgi:hypothetical protein